MIPKHLDNNRNNPVIGTETIKMPPGILFDSYKHNLCPSLEKNIPNTKCTSGVIEKIRYRIEAVDPNKEKNKKWWKDSHRILKSEDIFR